MKLKGSFADGAYRERLLTKIFTVLCTVVFIFLWIAAMLFSWQNVEFWNEFVYKRTDNLFVNIVGMAGGLLIAWLLGKAAEKYADQRKLDVIAVIVGILCVLASICWINLSKTSPQGDQANIIDYAAAYENGDTSSLLKGGYVANHRQQLGLITFVRILFKIFGQGNYKAYQYFSALTVFIIVYSGYRIIRLITEKNIRAEIIYLALMLCCIPMYGYTPFVYGEISSTAFAMLSAWILLSTLKKFGWWKMAGLAVCCGLMLQLRRNTLIIAIAFLTVIIVKTIKKPDSRTLAAGAFVIAGMVISQFGVSLMYKPFIPDDSKETPAILFVVMGIHDSIDGAPGWYDNYNEEIYEAMDFDPDAASEAARGEIDEFVSKCMDSPGYALEFFTLKINTQWNAPMYQCLVMNNSFYDEPHKFADDIYFNGNDVYYEGFMNIYQLLIYGGVMCCLILMGRKWGTVEKWVLLIGVYGGFLFSLFWEAKPRYVFPYFIMMIPYAAIGMEKLTGCCKDGVK